MEASIEISRNWLQKCLYEHEACRKKASAAHVFAVGGLHQVHDIGFEDVMPRRLLFLGDSNKDDIKLTSIDKTTEYMDYFALSHCWGKVETLKANKENLKSLQSGIKHVDLPETFRDAVDVTRALGYQYLWIDSLCIVQDDSEDWKYEAERMVLVYGNAVCTIMAMDSPNSTGGLFDISPSEENILISRAWVMQERMVSPRGLLFGKNRVRWECRTHDSAPDSPSLIVRSSPLADQPSTHPKQVFEFLRDFRPHGHDVGEGLDAFMDFYEDDNLAGQKHIYETFLKMWWEYLALYTPCKLSNASDKFWATNGVASVIQRHTRLRSTWGLWRDFIHEDLMWSVDLNGPLGVRPESWRGPFWSWVSVDEGRVINDYYRRLPAKPLLMIKPQVRTGVNTSFTESLPMPAWGRNSDHTSVELKGDLRRADITESTENDGRKVYELELETTGRWSENEIHEFRPDAPLELERAQVKSAQTLLVFHYEKGSISEDEFVDIRLVLIMSGEGNDRILRRIGYLETRYKEMRDYALIYEDVWWKQVLLR